MVYTFFLNDTRAIALPWLTIGIPRIVRIKVSEVTEVSLCKRDGNPL